MQVLIQSSILRQISFLPFQVFMLFCFGLKYLHWEKSLGKGICIGLRTSLSSCVAFFFQIKYMCVCIHLCMCIHVPTPKPVILSKLLSVTDFWEQLSYAVVPQSHLSSSGLNTSRYLRIILLSGFLKHFLVIEILVL